MDSRMKLCKKLELLDFIWIAIGAGLFILVSYINIAKFDYLNFSDPSSEMFEYIKAIWQEGSLVPKNWQNSNELLIRRNVFTALPIYAITKDLHLTYQINSVITNVALLLAFAFFLKKMGVGTRYIPVAVSLLLGMFSLGDIQTLLFITQGYSIYAIVIFFSLYTVSAIGECRRKKDKIKLFFCCALAVYMGITGVKMTLLLYIPLFLLDALLYFLVYLRENKILNSSHRHLTAVILVISSNLFGLLIHVLFFAEYTSGAYYSFNVLPLTVILTNFYKQTVALLESLSIKPIGILKSFATIDSLYKTLILFLTVGGGVYLYKTKKKRGLYIVGALVCSIAVSMICMGMANFRISSRYYFLAPVTAVIILILLYQDIQEGEYTALKTASALILIAGIILNCAAYYRHYAIGFIDETKQLQLKETKFLEERGYQTVFGSRWNANVLSGCSNGRLDTANICFGSFEPFKFLTNTDYYNRSGEVIFNLTDFQENLITSALLPSKRFLDSGQKIYEAGELNLYYFSENPLTEFEMPTEIGETAEYKLDHLSCKLVNGKLDIDTRSVISNFRDENRDEVNQFANTELGEWEVVLQNPVESPGSVVIWGPDLNIEGGTYRFILEYTAPPSENMIPGSFSVTSGKLANIMEAVDLESGSRKKAILEVEFDNSKNVDFVVKRIPDSQLLIHKIEIEKLK